ncbi:MAG TPA: hypothetical protein VKB36_22380 [Vicinamibacterales bacterium]|nr:hypothetical protein [Vicinamibacterales bacterium]
MRPKALIGVVAVLFAVSAGRAILSADRDNDNDQGRPGEIHKDDDPRVAVGFKYAKDQGIKLNLQHKDNDLVGLGSYLVNAVGGCNDCHTMPPYTKDPSIGLGAPKQINNACYLAGGAPFGPPPFGLPPNGSPVSRDLTPFENGKPAGLTFDQFRHVIRTGEDPDNPGHVLRVMPWPVYQTMTDHDLRAIYEYLSAIPAIPKDTCGVPSV